MIEITFLSFINYAIVIAHLIGAGYLIPKICHSRMDDECIVISTIIVFLLAVFSIVFAAHDVALHMVTLESGLIGFPYIGYRIYKSTNEEDE